jgi:two-component system CheB/CheR fusion protein
MPAEKKEPKEKKSSSKKKAPAKDTEKSPKTDEFPVVGLEASAGGLEAFETFFQNVPADSGMAFVVVRVVTPEEEEFLLLAIEDITDKISNQ